jgi:hypothetical protein
VNEALVRTLGPAEARRLTDQVKRDAETLWRKLVELYEAGAHTALNYSSWADYCATEFGFGRAYSYRLLEAGRVAERVSHGRLNERQARELAPLLRDGDEDSVVEVFQELRAEYGEELTAEKVRAAVEKRLRPKPTKVLSAAPSEPEGKASLARPRIEIAPQSEATEKQFMAAVIETAQMLGWLVYHTHDSRHSAAGFPDLVLVRDRVVFAELKAEKEKISDEQEAWLAALGFAGAEVFCWRPSDWEVIEEALR